LIIRGTSSKTGCGFGWRIESF